MIMKNMKKLFSALLILALTPSVLFAVTSPETIIYDAVGVINEMVSKSDAADVAKMIRGAKAVAIVPSMVKAGFVVGGEYGEGLILCYENGKWFGPGFYNISGASFGLQIGAQSVALVMAVTNEKGVDAFLHSRTKLGGDVSVAAGPSGRRAEAAVDTRGKASIYSYSISKGLFAGVSLDGSVISISVKRDEQYWKKSIKAVDALKIKADDKRIQPLIKALDDLIKKAD